MALWVTVALSVALLLSMHPSTYLASRPGSSAPVGLVVLIAEVFIPEVTDRPLNVSLLIVTLYLAFSHLAYAVANWAQSRQSWLDPDD